MTEIKMAEKEEDSLGGAISSKVSSRIGGNSTYLFEVGQTAGA